MNSGQRPTKYISLQSVQKIIGASCYSFCIGRRLNLFVTIHFTQAGLDADEVHSFITRFFKCASDWIRRRTKGEKAFYIYVLENPATEGLHLHFLIHVPRELKVAYLRRQKIWFVLAGGKSKSGVLHSKPIYDADRCAEQYLENGLKGILRYLLKGLLPEHCPTFGVKHRRQGVVIGKRCGFSQSLGVGAAAGDTIPLLDTDSNVFRSLDKRTIAAMSRWAASCSTSYGCN